MINVCQMVQVSAGTEPYHFSLAWVKLKSTRMYSFSLTTMHSVTDRQTYGYMGPLMENFKEQEPAGYQEVFLFQNKLSIDGTACLKMMLIKGVSMDLKEHWKEDGKQRWTSWTNCPPSPSGHIYFSELVWSHQVNYFF